MELKHFLKDFIEESAPLASLEEYQYSEHLLHYRGQSVDWATVDIAILYWKVPDLKVIKTALNALATNFKKGHIIDLGEVLEDKIPLLELIEWLLEKNIFPLIISSDEMVSAIQMQAYERSNELLSLALIDSRLPFSSYTPKGLINQLLEWHPNLLIHLNCIGYQNYLVNQASVDFLEDKYFEVHRLGAIQTDIGQVEAMVRDMDLATFDINAINSSAAPARSFMNPNGFRAVEACQIVRYMTMSETLRSLSLTGFDLSLDHRGQTANLLAQLIWFAIEGYYARLGEYPVDTSQMNAYLVDNLEMGQPITFYKSSRSDRWWLEIPKAIAPKHQLIACSYQEYKQSCDGELPDRLLSAISRLGL